MTATELSGVAAPRMSKSEATRARIIAAAGIVLSEAGYPHTRLSAIAAEAGMQTGSLYYYFDSKEELVEEALSGGARIAHKRVRSAIENVPDGASAGERLSVAVRSFISVRLEIGIISSAHIRNYRDLPGEMRDRLKPELEAFSRLWDDLVLAAVESGDIRNDIDSRALHLFVVHTSEQLARWPSAAKGSIEDTVDVMFRLMFDGLAGAQ
ncbi:TetR/AcrR family transcriptional regulator [Rhodococcus wratislaviensis]|uniref:TetR/AcrR family transcriptional regulator n=1 Tax=Rhodococcus wratislaviensis TaxID=44752 RepID=UPI00364A959F